MKKTRDQRPETGDQKPEIWPGQVCSLWSLVSGLFSLILLLAACASAPPPEPQTAARPSTPAELKKIWDDPPALLEEAKKQMEAANVTLALAALQRIVEGFPKSDVYEEAGRLADDIQSRIGAAGLKIGVLLPLSGSFARFGESTLNGIACAIGLFDPCGGSFSKTEIVVKDTKGDGALTRQAIHDLVETEQVAAIIGPLLSADAQEAATEAQTLPVPMILLSPRAGPTQTGDFIFQHALLPEAEVSAIVARLSDMGIKKFAVMYPKNRYGEEYKSLFAAKLEQSGAGKIVAESAYAADIPDFSGLVEQLTHQRAVQKILAPPQVSKIGFFIPDSYREAYRIAQALEGLFEKGPTLIGTSRWYHPQLVEQPLASLEGVLIDTPFNPEAERAETREFTENFMKTYGAQPAWLEAFGFDAARLLMQAAAKALSQTPADIRNSLSAIRNFPSVSGPLSWNEQRVSQWPLDFVTVKEEKFVPAHP